MLKNSCLLRWADSYMSSFHTNFQIISSDIITYAEKHCLIALALYFMLALLAFLKRKDPEILLRKSKNPDIFVRNHGTRTSFLCVNLHYLSRVFHTLPLEPYLGIWVVERQRQTSESYCQNVTFSRLSYKFEFDYCFLLPAENSYILWTTLL